MLYLLRCFPNALPDQLVWSVALCSSIPLSCYNAADACGFFAIMLVKKVLVANKWRLQEIALHVQGLTSGRFLSQERLWKRTAGRVFAHAAAAAARKGGLKPTPLGEQMRAEAAAALAQVRMAPTPSPPCEPMKLCMSITRDVELSTSGHNMTSSDARLHQIVDGASSRSSNEDLRHACECCLGLLTWRLTFLSAQEELAKSRKERMASNRSAGTSGAQSTFSSLDTNGKLQPFFCQVNRPAFKQQYMKYAVLQRGA